MWIKAAVLRSADMPYRVEDVELRDPGPGEVRLRIVATGLCHTDLLPRASGFMASPPIVTGHEASGVVDEIGDEVVGLVPGDHVIASFDSCRQCDRRVELADTLGQRLVVAKMRERGGEGCHPGNLRYGAI